MADSNDLDVFLLAAKEFAYSLCLCLDSTSRRLLHKDVSALTVFKSKEDQIYSLVEAHDKAGHGRFCKGDRLTVTNLVYPKRND